MIVGLGTDLCRVERIAAMLERYGERFERRIYTAEERAYCRSRPKTAANHFAGRFAAKEAAFKALGTGLSMGMRWRDVEVTRRPGEPPRLRFVGRAAQRADRMGVDNIHLSITHDGDMAMAVVVLERTKPPSDD